MKTLYGIKGTKEAFKAGFLAANLGATDAQMENGYQMWLRMNPEYQSHKPTTDEVVRLISDFVNNFGLDEKEFISLMADQHRTLQQSFTKLMLKWLEHVATPEYRTDGRNEGSQQTAQWMLKAWAEWIEKNKPNTVGMPPSSWLRMI